MNLDTERESVNVLVECIELQTQKGSDYQAKESTVKQAHYYPNGIITIHDIMHAKMLRMKSLMEKEQAGGKITFESLEDSAKDLINYASFFVAFCRGKVDGQSADNDKYNKPLSKALPLIQKAAEILSNGVPTSGFDTAAFEADANRKDEVNLFAVAKMANEESISFSDAATLE